MLKKKLIAIGTALALLISMAASIAMPALAESAEKVKISTAEELIALASGDLSGNYIQIADIDLSDLGFSPIGTPKAPFTGVYDGNGYEISGLVLESNADFQGLFGFNCGKIRNVTLAEDCTISGSSYVGAIAGFNQGTIENCISRASVTHKAASVDSTAQTYGIMSQNLCQWGDNDLTAYDDYEDSVSHSRRPSMIKRIENSNPDILLFQEVSFNNYRYNGKTITAWDTFLRNTLTDYTIVGTYRSNSDKEGVTIGYRKDKFELVEEGMFWLSDNPDAPRAQQGKAWDAACVRTAQWVVLKDKTTGQQIIACSTHTDHVGLIARDKGTQLIAARMAALQEKYPDALLAVGGDFNNAPRSQGYINMENGLNGLLDDSRYVAEERLNNIGTHGSIDKLDYVGGELDTIDYIYINSATTEAPLFYVMNDNYDDLRPSDHEGVFASIKVRENHFVGGICGANGGEISNIIAEGAVEGGEVFGHGAVMGNALLMGASEAIFAKDSSTENMAGTPISFEDLSLEALPETPNQTIVDKLNQTSGVFELREGEYAILEGCSQYELAKVIFKGVPKYCFVGSTFTFEVEEGLEVYLNGEPFEGRSIVVPSGGAVISVMEPIQSVIDTRIGGDFIVKDEEDFLYLCENLPFFQYRGVTIHLFCDIDLSAEALSGFTGFSNPAFSMEGYNHTIKNWGSKEAPGGVGFFHITTGAGGANFIRNLNFSNCHVSGYNASVVYSVGHGNTGYAGLPTHLELSGIAIDGCSLVSVGQSSGMLLSRFGSTGQDFTVDISDIRITNSSIDANSSEHIGFLVGKTRTASGAVATFNVRDCYLYGNIIENAVPGVGFVAGSVEADTYANFSNIGVFANHASGTGISYLVSDSYCAGGIKGEGLIFAENTTETDGAYMVEGVYADAAATLSNYWNDAELTALIEGSAEEYTATTPEVMASGEPGWALNSRLEEPAFWWAQDGTIYKPCQKSERLCKVTLNLAETSVYYLPAGATLELPDIGSGSYKVEAGESTIEEGILTVKSDTVISAEIPVGNVNSAVTEGNYFIEDESDWMYVADHLDYFNHEGVTLVLAGNIDLSKEIAADFAGFSGAAFSFDGGNYTISDWTALAESTENYRALFPSYTGKKICNLNLSGLEVGGGYGRSLLIGGYAGTGSLELSNIHIKDCLVDATVSGNQMALFISKPTATAESGAIITIKDCSVVGSSLKNTCGERINNSGLLVGSAYGGFNYYISNVVIEGCRVETNTGAGGIVVGAIEQTSAMVMEQVGVFNSSLQPLETNEIPGIFAGEMAGTASLSLKGCMAAGNTADEREKMAMVCHYGTTVTVSAVNCMVDFEPLEVQSTNNNAGATGSTSVLAGVEQLSNAAFKTGEAAWKMNDKLNKATWLVGEADGYPSLFAAEGYQAPLKVTFGADAGYTNGLGKLSAEEFALISNEEGHWLLNDALATADAVYTADTALTLAAHAFSATELIPEGEARHKITCALEGCGAEQIEDCVFDQGVIVGTGDGAYHDRSCLCGNYGRAPCTLESHECGVGYHQMYCEECLYGGELEPCEYQHYIHAAGTNTHIGTCKTCRSESEALPCQMDLQVDIAPEMGVEGSGTYRCTENCGNAHQATITALGDGDGNGEVTMADVVLILRVINGTLDSSLVNEAANVYKDDGYTKNGGFSTADALMIMKYVLAQA